MELKRLWRTHRQVILRVLILKPLVKTRTSHSRLCRLKNLSPPNLQKMSSSKRLPPLAKSRIGYQTRISKHRYQMSSRRSSNHPRSNRNPNAKISSKKSTLKTHLASGTKRKLMLKSFKRNKSPRRSRYHSLQWPRKKRCPPTKLCWRTLSRSLDLMG